MPGFSSHNLLMSQRYVFLASTCPAPTAEASGDGTYSARHLRPQNLQLLFHGTLLVPGIGPAICRGWLTK